MGHGSGAPAPAPPAPAPEEKEEGDPKEKAPDPEDHVKLLELVSDFEEKSVDEIKAIIEELQTGRYDNFGFPGEVGYHIEEMLEEIKRRAEAPEEKEERDEKASEGTLDSDEDEDESDEDEDGYRSSERRVSRDLTIPILLSTIPTLYPTGRTQQGCHQAVRLGCPCTCSLLDPMTCRNGNWNTDRQLF